MDPADSDQTTWPSSGVDPALGILDDRPRPTTGQVDSWEMVKAIGLPAALIGKLAGLNVRVVDRVTSGPKADLVRSPGAVYHLTPGLQLAFELDVIIECTGIGQVIPESILKISAGCSVFLTGIGPGGAPAGPCSGTIASWAA